MEHHSEQKCDAGIGLAPGTTEDLCQSKRQSKCQGTDCFLDSYDLLKPGAEYNSIQSTAYCVEFDDCYHMCDEWDSCTGFNYNKEHRFCTLTSSATCRSVDNREEREVGWFYSSRSPTDELAHVPCARLSDYQRPVGSLSATRHVTNVQYVLDPLKTASIEITGPAVAERLNDRIMPIACSETCGVDEPTKRVLPNDRVSEPSAAHWIQHEPVPEWKDPYENWFELVNVNFSTGEFVTHLPELVTAEYIKSDDHICKGGNMMHDDITQHLCYTKCAAGTCVGADCHCDGYISGRDTPSSTAACVDLALAKQICDGIDDCGSVDVHSTIPRAHFNSGGCDNFQASVAYDLYVKNAPKREDATIPQQQEYTNTDFGKSWSEMLRFRVEGLQGGKYKLCLCDASMSTTIGTCGSLTDFKVELGFIHVSGLSCMLTESYRRKTCISQYHGGLRCYDSWQVEPLTAANLLRPTPPDASITLYTAPAAPTPPAEISIAWCLYGPEELTRNIPYCQRVAPWHSLYNFSEPQKVVVQNITDPAPRIPGAPLVPPAPEPEPEPVVEEEPTPAAPDETTTTGDDDDSPAEEPVTEIPAEGEGENTGIPDGVEIPEGLEDIDLENIDLENVDLEGVDLDNIDLDNIDTGGGDDAATGGDTTTETAT